MGLKSDFINSAKSRSDVAFLKEVLAADLSAVEKVLVFEEAFRAHPYPSSPVQPGKTVWVAQPVQSPATDPLVFRQPFSPAPVAAAPVAPAPAIGENTGLVEDDYRFDD